MKKIGTAIVIGAAALVAATSISAASPAKTTAKGQKNIVQTAVATGKFKTLVALVKTAGLAGTLSAPGNLTVLALTDKDIANPVITIGWSSASITRIGFCSFCTFDSPGCFCFQAKAQCRLFHTTASCARQAATIFPWGES